MKQYIGIILSVIFAFTIRVLAEFDIVEINSISYLAITPMFLGFVPFFLNHQQFLHNTFKVVMFPLIAVVLFLIVAIITRLEDVFCLLIIGIPYIFISMIISLILRSILKNKEDGISKNAIPIFMIPILLGMIEKQLPKQQSELLVSNEIVINCDKRTVWSHLLSVPDLSDSRSSNSFTILGIPRPIKSTYDSVSNVRLGYFENGIVLNETVTKRDEFEKLEFKINLDKSKTSASPTLSHVLKSHTIEIENIRYELEALDKNTTKLKLSTTFTVNSNVLFYGKFWSELILDDFENNLLTSLKKVIEKQ
jgi:hypothetical protein